MDRSLGLCRGGVRGRGGEVTERGGDAAVNAGVFRELLAGKGGPVRDAVLLNSAAALVAFEGPGPSLVDDLRAALPRVAAAVDSGAGERLLADWARVSTSLR